MDEITVLREENAILRERLRQMEALLAPDDARIPIEWGLVAAERRVFAALTRRDVVTKEMLHAALYSDKRYDSDPALAVVESHVCKLRRKLKPFGVTITGKRHIGYMLHQRERWAVKTGRTER